MKRHFVSAIAMALSFGLPGIAGELGVDCSKAENQASGVKAESAGGQTQLIAQAKENEKEWSAYSNSKYSYWDAAVLSKHWNQNLGDTKARMGGKILAGEAGQAYLEQYLLDARIQALGSANNLNLYADSSFHYDDAAALAKFWGDANASEAKLRIEKNLIMGNEEIIKKALNLAKQG